MGLRDLMPINQRHHLHFIYCHFERRQPENQNTTMQSASRLRGVHHCNSSGKMADGALSYRLERLPLAQVHAASITVMLYFILAYLGGRAFRPRNGSKYCATLDWWLQVVVLSGGKRHPQIFPWLEGSIASSDGGENTGNRLGAQFHQYGPRFPACLFRCILTFCRRSVFRNWFLEAR